MHYDEKLKIILAWVGFWCACFIAIGISGCADNSSASSDPIAVAAVPVEVPSACTDLVRPALQEFPDCAILFAADSHGTCAPRAETREEFSARPTAPFAYCARLEYERVRDSER